jgi:hypothetical protein
MPNGLERILDELDIFIDAYDLHAGDPTAPVRVDALLEPAIVNRLFLPDPCSAISVLLGGDASITFNRHLLDPSRSADERHAKAHEFGHIVRRHRGYQVMWRASWTRGDPFERYLHSREERECEVIASYLLVSFAALHTLRDQDIGYIASMLDVPEQLVQLRLEIKGKYRR